MIVVLFILLIIVGAGYMGYGGGFGYGGGHGGFGGGFGCGGC